MSEQISPLFDDQPDMVLSAGQALFRAGEKVAEMFVVRSGRVLLERHTPQGMRLVLQTAGPGVVLAEASAYSSSYHCDAVASAASVVAALPRRRFLDRLAEDPRLAAAWSAMLARGVQAARLRAEIRTIPRLSDRLDAWLGEGNRLPARGGWQEVADEIGVTREAFYRELSRRRRAGEGTFG